MELEKGMRVIEGLEGRVVGVEGCVQGCEELEERMVGLEKNVPVCERF